MQEHLKKFFFLFLVYYVIPLSAFEKGLKYNRKILIVGVFNYTRVKSKNRTNTRISEKQKLFVVLTDSVYTLLRVQLASL